MKVLFKKLTEEAIQPTYAYISDAGADVYATSVEETVDYVQYGTGIIFQIDPSECNDWYIKCRPRSSISKYDLIMANGVATIDRAYTGEVFFRFKRHKDVVSELKKFIDGIKNISKNSNSLAKFSRNILTYIQNYKFDDYKIYKVGDKIAQMILEKREKIEFIEVNELNETDRGSGGFGSSGN